MLPCVPGRVNDGIVAGGVEGAVRGVTNVRAGQHLARLQLEVTELETGFDRYMRVAHHVSHVAFVPIA